MALTTIGFGGEVAAERVRAALCKSRPDVSGQVFKRLLQLALALSIGVLGVLLWAVVHDGWPVLSTRLDTLLSGQLVGRAANAGLFNAIRGTLWIAALVVLTFPIGIGAAVYLEEYAPRNRLTRFVNVNIRNLAGVPSVVYGILGLTVFVNDLRGFTGGPTLLAGAVTIAILVLPIVIITAAEAVRAVPTSLREGGFGVGATRWEVTRTMVLPYAAPGILTGTVLSLARAMGEAAPILLIGAVGERLSDGTGLVDPSQLTERFTALPIVIAAWAKKPLNSGFPELSAAAIVVMLAIVLLANSAAILLRNRFEKKRG